MKVLFKRQGKDDRSKELQVPVSSSVLDNLQQKEDEEEKERNEIKKLVLQASQSNFSANQDGK